jgi:hypothetical protein
MLNFSESSSKVQSLASLLIRCVRREGNPRDSRHRNILQPPTHVRNRTHRKRRSFCSATQPRATPATSKIRTRATRVGIFRTLAAVVPHALMHPGSVRGV